MSLPEWQRVDPRAARRERLRLLARDEIRSAIDADEPHVEEAFRIVLATVEAGALPQPVRNGRTTLKGRDQVREQAIELGRRGLSARAVAIRVGVPYTTAYSWLRTAGASMTRAEWEEQVRSR